MTEKTYDAIVDTGFAILAIGGVALMLAITWTIATAVLS